MLAHPLIVPIHLSALPVPEPSKQLVSLQLPMKQLEQRNVVSSFPKENASVPVTQPAILLHWVLPTAFKHGVQKADGLAFPAVPNRWLVVRSHVVAGKVILKKWIVESNYCVVAAKITESNYIVETEEGMQIVRLGRKVELPEGTRYEEAAPSNYLQSPLTAVPGWDPAFAAKFFSAENVFAMRDEFEGVKLPVLQDLSYQVFGWYAEPSRDLLAQTMLHAQTASDGTMPASALAGFLEQMGWEYQGQGEAPQGILCHGMLQGIDTSGRAASNIPTLTQLYVANSAVEAAGTYLSHQALMQPRWADLLDQYQYATIQEHGWPYDPKDHLQQRQHDHGFQSVGGSTHFAIQVRKKDAPQLSPPSSDTAPTTFEFPREITASLTRLNQHQRQMERLRAQALSLAHDLYAKLLVQQLPDDELPEPKVMARFVPDFKPLRETLEAQAEAQSQVDEHQKDLVRTLGKLCAPPACEVLLELLPVAGQRFWRPNEPTVLITGLRPSEAYGKGERVIGRDLTKLATSFWFQDRARVLPQTTELGTLGDLVPAKAIEALWRESKLFNPAYYPQIAGEVASQAGTMAEEIVQALQAAATLWHRDPAQYRLADRQALPHRFEYQRWQMPWVPMYMDWEIEFAFFQTPGLATQVQKQTGSFSGRCLLSSVMAGQIDQIEEVLGMPRSGDAPLSQELSGLADQFLSRLDGLQLPLMNMKVADTKRRRYKRLDTAEVAMLGAEHPWGPLMGPGIYSLVRAGGFLFKSITVIDAFGQSLKVYDGKMRPAIPSRRMQLDASKRYFQMPLQLNFGARLQLDWIDARTHSPLERSNSDPATSPIFGWLVLQQERQRLAVFASDGRDMGELSVQDGRVGFEATAPEALGKPENAVLNAWLQAMRAQPAAKLEEMLAAIGDYTAFVRQPSSRASRREVPALPTGLPLALARLHCKLERQEQHIQNYRFSSAPPPIDLESRAFAFRPGNDHDGVLFYTLDPAWGWMQAGKSFFSKPAPQSSNLALKFASHNDEALLYLLLDPQKPVEISSSILPTQAAQLDETYIKRGLATMEHKVQVHALLTPASAVSAPLPDLPGTRWAWNSTALGGVASSGTVEIGTRDQASFEPILAKDILFKMIQEKQS